MEKNGNNQNLALGNVKLPVPLFFQIGNELFLEIMVKKLAELIG
tara:strand:+ start:632 stop:763 length:132 start_codon:yes stop_codon:yes gene_type:complete